MQVSRRIFLGGVAAAPVLARGDAPPARVEVVDLGCVLPESLAGFKTQVGDLRHADVLIAPGVGRLVEADVWMLQRYLQRGATVLLECRADIAELGINVGDCVKPDRYFPYVEYSWPMKLKIREFAPLCFEPAPGDEIIATFAGQPVGLRRRVRRGTVVAIGSPLGPVFLTGDPDARRWLDGFLARP